MFLRVIVWRGFSILSWKVPRKWNRRIGSSSSAFFIQTFWSDWIPVICKGSVWILTESFWRNRAKDTKADETRITFSKFQRRRVFLEGTVTLTFPSMSLVHIPSFFIPFSYLLHFTHSIDFFAKAEETRHDKKKLFRYFFHFGPREIRRSRRRSPAGISFQI